MKTREKIILILARELIELPELIDTDEKAKDYLLQNDEWDFLAKLADHIIEEIPATNRKDLLGYIDEKGQIHQLAPLGLRDYFAGQSLIAYASIEPTRPGMNAEMAYAQADAMLKVRAA